VKQKYTSMAALTALLLTAAACSSNGGNAASTTAAPTTVASDTSVAADTTVVSTAAPKAVISLSPTTTEMVFAIGAGSEVIAVDDQSNYPAEALTKPHDLSGYTPNVEAIAALKPDLVLLSDTKIQPQLEKLGIKVWVATAATTFDDVYKELGQLGALTGHAADAASLVASMHTEIDKAVASVPKTATPLTYYHELDNTLYSVTSATFIGQMYGLFGLKNIADGAQAGNDYPQLNAEYIVKANPDLVFLADTKCCGESAEKVAARPGWSVITAVKNGGVVAMDDDIASRWGPRVVDYIKAIAAAIAKVPAKG
jgi:iron complex transport system substrate-binding protein